MEGMTSSCNGRCVFFVVTVDRSLLAPEAMFAVGAEDMSSLARANMFSFTTEGMSSVATEGMFSVAERKGINRLIQAQIWSD